MKIFTVLYQAYPDLPPTPQFTIEKKDETSALEDARAWARRHGYNTRNIQAMSVRPANEVELSWETHNDWIP